MKPSKRNIANATAKKNKLQSGPPKVSRYALKVRQQLKETKK